MSDRSSKPPAPDDTGSRRSHHPPSSRGAPRVSQASRRTRLTLEVRATVEPAVVVFRDPARLSLQLFVDALRSDRRARAGTAVLVLMAIAGIVGALLPAAAARPMLGLAGPSGAHVFGTDAQGRDVLLLVLAGTIPTLGIGLLATSIASVIGVALGALAGFRRGAVDAGMHRAIEAVGAVPSAMLLVLVQLGAPHPGLFSLVGALVIARFSAVAVVVRADVLRTLELEYVVAARALGAGAGRILARHVLPSALATALVLSAFGLATMVALQTAVAALGVGWVPATSWGALLGQLRGSGGAWWLALFPGVFVAVAIGGAVLLGESLRDALDPRLRGTRDFG